jgi:hypothetical protein
MFTLALDRLKSRTSILQGLGFMGIFILIYTVIDYNNLSYDEMAIIYGSYLVYTNIVLNVLMASLSSLLLLLSTANAELKGKESLGSNLSFISVLFGILTYGCTPCVIAFFASLGIAFSVIALPLAGLPYKFISIGLLLIGLIWTYYELQYGKCKVKV